MFENISGALAWSVTAAYVSLADAAKSMVPRTVSLHSTICACKRGTLISARADSMCLTFEHFLSTDAFLPGACECVEGTAAVVAGLSGPGTAPAVFILTKELDIDGIRHCDGLRCCVSYCAGKHKASCPPRSWVPRSTGPLLCTSGNPLGCVQTQRHTNLPLLWQLMQVSSCVNASSRVESLDRTLLMLLGLGQVAMLYRSPGGVRLPQHNQGK